jgi:hypothetical protein
MPAPRIACKLGAEKVPGWLKYYPRIRAPDPDSPTIPEQESLDSLEKILKSKSSTLYKLLINSEASKSTYTSRTEIDIEIALYFTLHRTSAPAVLLVILPVGGRHL